MGLDPDKMWRLIQGEKAVVRFGPGVQIDQPTDRRFAQLWPRLTDPERETLYRIAEGMVLSAESGVRLSSVPQSEVLGMLIEIPLEGSTWAESGEQSRQILVHARTHADAEHLFVKAQLAPDCDLMCRVGPFTLSDPVLPQPALDAWGFKDMHVPSSENTVASSRRVPAESAPASVGAKTPVRR